MLKVWFLGGFVGKAFLLDGIGAFFSAFFLGVLLPMLQEHIGMPLGILYMLGLWALLYALFSLSCFFLVRRSQRSFLLGVIVLNIVYASVTIGLVWVHWNELKPLGFAYFLTEIAIIAVLVHFEKKLIKKR